MNALGNRAQALGAMEHRVEGRHHGQERLRRTHIRRRLFAANMLFAGLKAQTVGPVAARIDADADKPARKRALVGILASHIGRVRSAITHRHAEPLGRTDGDIGAHRARLFQKG